MTQEGLDVGEDRRMEAGKRQEKGQPGSQMRANGREDRQVPLKNTSALPVVKANSFHCEAHLCP